MAAETAIAATGRRDLYLDRRVCTVTPDRIEVRPAKSIIVLPLVGLAVGLLCFLAAALWTADFPLWSRFLLTIVAVVIVPISGVGLVYVIAGAHIVIDRQKQSAVLQQGYLGMGVGTEELIPFWKIERIQVRELSLQDERGNLEDFSQYEVAIVKISGKLVSLGTVTVVRSEAKDGLARAKEIADLVAEMAGTRASRGRRPRKGREAKVSAS